MKWIQISLIILSGIFIPQYCLGIAVRVGPQYYDRGEGGDTEMRLIGVAVSTAQWSLKDGINERKETSVSFALVRPQPDMIDIDLTKSEIKVFCDDKGTDLLAGNEKKPGAKDLIEVSFITSHYQTLNFKIKAPCLPDPLATKLRLEGTLYLITGTNRTNVENREVPVKEGSEINVGPYMMKITKIGLPDIKKFPWVQNQNAISMTIEWEDNRRVIREMQFMDANGNHANVSMVSASFGKEKGRNVYEYILMNQMDKLNINVAYWSGTAETALPFKVEVGLDAEPQDVK